MPINPEYEFVPRHLKEEEPELFELLDKFSQGIEETVNFGSRIFQWCNESLEGNADKEIPKLLMFRHILEQLDAVSILIRQSAAEPCKLQLRSMLEALLSIQYLLEENQKDRAYAYLVCHTEKKIKTYKKLDPSTLQGKQLKGVLKDSQFEGIEVTERFELKKMVSEQQQLYKREGFKEAYEELKRLRKQGRKNPNWYELFDGPRDLERLAAKFKKRDIYEFFYRNWSEYIHGRDIISGNLGEDSTGTYLMSIRQPFEAQFIASMAITMALESYRLMIKHYVPLQITHYRVWYVEKLREFYAEISKQQRIIKRSDNE